MAYRGRRAKEAQVFGSGRIGGNLVSAEEDNLLSHDQSRSGVWWAPMQRVLYGSAVFAARKRSETG